MKKEHLKIKQIMERELSCSAHNIDHVMRVYDLCKTIATDELNVDMDVLIPAVLLHDIARVKESEDKSGSTDHALLGSEMAEQILRELNFDSNNIEKIKHCILAHRYRTGHTPESIEAKILFDADKLDAIGAIGIARCFMISGKSGQALRAIDDIDAYGRENLSENGRIKDLSKHTPFMEYEFKLKKIPQKLYTESAKQIGQKRVEYMNEFFTRLETEMNGEI